MNIVHEDKTTTIEFYLNDLTEKAQKDLIEALGGDNGNYDVFPFATIVFEECEDDCPFEGDIADDCSDCAYSGDYEFKNGECVERDNEGNVNKLTLTSLD